MLSQEEYVEQEYFFSTLLERLQESHPLQEILVQVKEELLATTKLPLAIDFLVSELKHQGIFGSAMQRLTHYFTPFQIYVIQEAENEQGNFDFQVGLKVLQTEAAYRAGTPNAEGLFMYQLETISRNRLRYSEGLKAMSTDPMFDTRWQEWLMVLPRHLGLVDLADLIYLRSQWHLSHPIPEATGANPELLGEPLFGEKEGKIAVANRGKDPVFLFSSMQRHLHYPKVPIASKADREPQLMQQLQKRMEQLEQRMKVMEEEQRGGLDISQFYKPPPS